MSARHAVPSIEATVAAPYKDCAGMTGGKNASCIPFLASVDPTLFGLAVVTVDGQVFEAGDSRVQFALESISKVFTMALALEDLGADEFHRRFGADPTGLPFNSVIAMELHNDMPLTPLVNAGAMSTTSAVIAPNAEQRWDRILDAQSRFAGRQISMSEKINTSEQTTNTHNRAIAWLLETVGAMYSDPMQACEIYTRQCSTLVTTVDLATMGATLASGGINPVTGERVMTPSNVPHMLAEMTMEGLYTRSGDWAYDVGLPAKSGVGGGLMAVAPGKLAIAGFSPPLDTAGNSVRAQAGVSQIAAALKLSLYRVPGLP